MVDGLSPEAAKAALSRAELSFTQALWYAWGVIDSGVCKDTKVEAFEFANRVKDAHLTWALGDSGFLESIQGQWAKYVAEKS